MGVNIKKFASFKANFGSNSKHVFCATLFLVTKISVVHEFQMKF